MAATAITDFFILTAHVNFDMGGWTERYYLLTDTIATVKARAIKLLSNRADILGKGAVIAGATLSQFTKFKDRYPLAGFRYAPINLATEADADAIATVNDWEVGPLWRFDTELGKFGNRLIRGLRDAQISNNDAAYNSSAINTLAEVDAWAGAVAATTTHANALKMYLSTVLHYTRHIVVATKTAYVNGVRTMTGTARDWAAIQYRKISSHDCGERYGVGSGRQMAWD